MANAWRRRTTVRPLKMGGAVLPRKVRFVNRSRERFRPPDAVCGVLADLFAS